MCVCNTKAPVTLEPLPQTNTNLFADCGATRKKAIKNSDLAGSSRVRHAFASHSP